MAGPPGSGLAEYQALVQHSRQSIESALTSLHGLASQGSAASKAAVSAFSEEVDRLQAASVRVRARAQAMQARGDAYFENWEESMTSIADPGIRASAEQHHADLQRSFGSIKVVLGQARTSFQSFLAGLRKLRTTLEADPSRFSAAPTQELVRNTQADGRRVEQDLDTVAVELRRMTEMLIPPDQTAKQ
jgi:hypothetical protein